MSYPPEHSREPVPPTRWYKCFWYAVFIWVVAVLIGSIILGLFFRMPLPGEYQDKGPGIKYYGRLEAMLMNFVGYFLFEFVIGVAVFIFGHAKSIIIIPWLLLSPVCILPLIMYILRRQDWHLFKKMDAWMSLK